ncbi:AraC family transcriptional regulator [Desulfobulbus rhabdoformis]|uniref:AraC family transcriptional regulator n=1 Tax=Desulfobulbus rhabdoformis TaxID=34032 RepID=UPI0019630C84|nr:AraC family transcriptional regulator [Desulfobulbus rhabdoformis]MBM9615008.1 AraC family transcriptional regulator [Desulfobulbus rhabdoformis]
MYQMIELFERFDLPELFTESNLDGVRFFKSNNHTPRTPLIYDPGIFIVAQGSKKGYLADMVFQYDANNYLVTSVPIPFECETFATPEAPFLGLYIDIDMSVLHELIGQLEESNGIQNTKLSQRPKGVGPAQMDENMFDAVCRLLKCLQSRTETKILGPGLIKEILFRVLCGTQASSLFALATHTGNFASVSRALKTIHSDYGSKLDVEQLASMAGMSVSTFHRAFKSVTSDSPGQYLKKIRLSKARDFIRNDQMKAYIAADKVGYESVSQFSREFKRYFGQTPADLIKELRNT